MAKLIKGARKIWDYGIGRTILAAGCAHSVSISIGICQGYSAILIPQLIGSEDFNITSEECSWIASLGAITNPIGSILSGLLGEYLGRKPSIVISSAPFLVGWICIASAKNIWWIYAGRLITGIAAGMSTASYTYVAEVTTPEKRGIFQALGPVSASFGILLTYTLGYFLKWDLVALISMSFCIFTFISMYFVPESPSHLMKKGKFTKSLENLIWLRRSNAVAQEEIEKYQASSAKLSAKTNIKNIYLSAITIKPFFILVTLFLLQELTGIYTILFYAVNFFKDSNLDIDENLCSIIVGIIRFVMSIVSAILIYRFDRKLLIMISSGGMAVSMLVAAAYFKYYEVNAEETRILTLLPLISILLNVSFSMIGMLPIPWILTGELFHLQVRPIVGGIVICLAQCFIFICVKIYYDLNAVFCFSGTLLLFSSASVAAFFFCKYLLPETKNKCLEEIQEYFQKTKNLENLVGVNNQVFSICSEVSNEHPKKRNTFDVYL